MSVPLWAWLAVLGLILVMLAIDLFAHRKAHVIGVREAAAWSAFWVALGVGFGALIWQVYGSEYGAQYFSGYVIEKSLSVDNVFVWAIIFSYFAVPREYQHRVLFYGVIGALIFRGVFIAAGSALLASFSWVIYLFGAFLIFTGIKMLRQREEHMDVGKSRLLRWFQAAVPHTHEYRSHRFWVRENGVWLATPLLSVLVTIEVTDVIFAVDSIPAIFAVTSEPFLVFTANAFAILGLRALFFLLADMMDRFVYLKIGLAFVLVWVGSKMMLHIWDIKIPTLTSLAVVVAIIAVSVVVSLRATRGMSSAHGATGSEHTPDEVAADSASTSAATSAGSELTSAEVAAGSASTSAEVAADDPGGSDQGDVPEVSATSREP